MHSIQCSPGKFAVFSMKDFTGMGVVALLLSVVLFNCHAAGQTQGTMQVCYNNLCVTNTVHFPS